MYISEYRVLGAHELPKLEIEEAVYPFLGPGRTTADIEQARVALEKAYQAKGFQAASVEVPQQSGKGGIIILQVSEGKLGVLRVKGARYFLPSEVKAMARSLAEGKVVNFNAITRDLIALNQNPDRQVTPTLRAGLEPGTVDIDLTVQDKFPLHGSVELNNRYSADTKPLRLNLSVNYSNLWQLGHTIGFSAQIAPEAPDQVKVFSGYYIARLPNLDWLSFMLQGTKQDSNVSTVSSAAVAGRGNVLGGRLLFTLPPGKDFYQSLSAGMDYKHFDQNIVVGATTILTPITYYPFSAAYNASWINKKAVTEFNADLVFHFRGMGSNLQQFENSRFNADGSFIYLRGDLSHTHELPAGFQLYSKVQGQVSDQPLINSEQFGGGGLGTARGYLEAEALGDNAVFGSLELRSPSLLNRWSNAGKNEWRVYAFGDAGLLTLNDPLPEQDSEFKLASIGVGSHLRLFGHLNGSIDAGIPLISQANTQAYHPLFTFRVWADF